VASGRLSAVADSVGAFVDSHIGRIFPPGAIAAFDGLVDYKESVATCEVMRCFAWYVGRLMRRAMRLIRRRYMLTEETCGLQLLFLRLRRATSL
jgi:hypothetical protein